MEPAPAPAIEDADPLLVHLPSVYPLARNDLHIVRVGPFGTDDKRVLFTLWASPTGDDEHAKEINAIVNSVNVVYAK